MSVTYGVACLECRQHSPEVGQGGFLGAPMLAEERTPDFPYGQGIPTFGWLYAGLSGLGIRPYELERFREFLVAHDGHRVSMWSESDDPAGWPPDLRQIVEDDSTSRDLEADAAEKARTEADGEFITATYELACPACGVTHVASGPELLRAAEPLRLSPEAVALFLARFDDEEEPYDYGWCHGLFGLLDPEESMDQLIPFVREHESHGLVATLKR